MGCFAAADAVVADAGVVIEEEDLSKTVCTSLYGEQQCVRNALAFEVALVRVLPHRLRVTPSNRPHLAALDRVVRVVRAVRQDVQRVHQTEAGGVLEEGDALTRHALHRHPLRTCIA